MYAEAGLLFPYFQSFSQEVQHLEEFCRIQKSNARGNIAQSSTVLEYDLGGEGDLFKAPEPIIEEPIMGLESLDPMTAAISMISAGDSVISSEAIKVADIESIQSNQLLSDVFYECKKDLLEKSAIKESFPEVLDINIPSIQNGEKLASEKDQSTVISMGPMQKSVSSGSLSSMEWINGGSMKPKFLDFETMDLGAAFGMRRAFSDGDIRTLGNCNTNLIHSPFGLAIGNFTIEERKQKLSRYRKKKTKRNFGRKIKYACRKALADNQPRVRGRFARTEAADVSNTSPPSRTTVNILTKK